MKVGIIAEYNPFHNGHKYQIEYIKEHFNPEIIVALTTNYFSMRGDISVLSKYDKTKVAIKEGIDLVLEYPYLYATQNADIFAYSAITILNLAKVDTIVAGSEANDLSLIEQVAKIEKEKVFQSKIKEYLDNGSSYRQAFSLALRELYQLELKENDLLNLKYYEAIEKINKNIKLILIKREGSNYLDDNISGKYPSAKALRSAKEIKWYVPTIVNNIYKEKGFYDINKFNDILKYNIITKDLSNIFEAKEGIENLFKPDFKDITTLALDLTNKRYKYARIMRFISYILTDYQKDIKLDDINYIRILGFNENGKKYVNKIKKEINVISNLKEGINQILDFEMKLAKLFSVVFNEDFVKQEQMLPYIKEQYLIGSDLDRTLLYNHEYISDYSKTYIREYARDNYFVMVSGRPFSATYHFFLSLGINQPFICDNGGSIYFPKDDGSFDVKLFTIKEDTFKRFIFEVKDYIYAILDTVYKTVYTNDIKRIPDFLVHFELPDTKLVEDDLINLANHDAILPNIWVYKDKIEDFNKVLEKYEDIDYHFWGVNDGYGDYEIFSKDTSKEKSLLYLAKMYNIKRGNIYAFGDDLNDLSMLKSEHIKGVAMPISSDYIKEQSYDIAPSSSEDDGLVKYLEKHNII